MQKRTLVEEHPNRLTSQLVLALRGLHMGDEDVIEALLAKGLPTSLHTIKLRVATFHSGRRKIFSVEETIDRVVTSPSILGLLRLNIVLPPPYTIAQFFPAEGQVMDGCRHCPPGR